MHTAGRQVHGSSPPRPPPSPPVSPATQMHAPVIPAAAAPMRVPGQIGGEQEASVGGLAPGTLARVSQAVITGQAPGGRERAQGHATAQPHSPPQAPFPLGPVGLTGCRVEDTPPGSSGHPDSDPAGCTLHPPFGWCSDATHRRHPGGSEWEWKPSLALFLGPPVPPVPPLAQQALASLACSTDHLPSPPPSPVACLSNNTPTPAVNNIHGFCLLSTHSLLVQEHPSVWSPLGWFNPWDSEVGEGPHYPQPH